MIIRRIIAVPFFIIFFIIFYIFLFFSALYQTTPKLYSEKLKETNIYKLIQNNVPELKGSEIWLQKITEKNLHAFWPYLCAKKDTFNIQVSATNDFSITAKKAQKKILFGENFPKYYHLIIEHISNQMVDHLYILLGKKNTSQAKVIIKTILESAYPVDKLRTELEKNSNLLILSIAGNTHECILSLNTEKVFLGFIKHINQTLEDSNTCNQYIKSLLNFIFKYEYFYGINVANNIDKDSLQLIQKELQEFLKKTTIYLKHNENLFDGDSKTLFDVISFVSSNIIEKKLTSIWKSLREQETNQEDMETLIKIFSQYEIPPFRPHGLSLDEMLKKANVNIHQKINSLYSSGKIINLFPKIDSFLGCDLSWKEKYKILKLHIPFSIKNRQNGELIKVTETLIPGFNEFRLLIGKLPYILLVMFGILLIFLLITSGLYSKKNSHFFTWLIIVVVLGCAISYVVTQVFDKIASPLLSEKTEHNTRGDIVEKMRIERNIQTLVALKNTLIENISKSSLSIIIFCILLLIVLPIIRALLKKNNDETTSSFDASKNLE